MEYNMIEEIWDVLGCNEEELENQPPNEKEDFMNNLPLFMVSYLVRNTNIENKDKYIKRLPDYLK